MERGNRYVNVKEERNKEIVFSIDFGGQGRKKAMCGISKSWPPLCQQPLGKFWPDG